MANTIDTSVLNGMNQTTGSASGKATATDDLSNSFMTLLVTQLKNQDPMNPMENAEMTSQLAQINTVNGIQDLNKTLEGITSQVSAGQNLQAAALIGQGVLVPGNRVAKEGEVTTPFGVELEEPADDITITITNDSGEVVRSFSADDIGALDAGVQSFTWDGTLQDGKTQAADGSYNVSIQASQGGEPVSVTALNYAQVGGVLTTDSGPRLDLGAISGQVGLDAVRQIL
ncbi:flagellar hook assembly protein FlgD [Halomonas sp. HP20-15]|uniref:flagellar hook assembly protein FlgD n=1 Tax=Halomonas sp. HP20-15 TaxID=3085901 RepID=UPI002981D7F6|nr:flagellar hook assembly protein FlgD [Halomonas sp. HP20-15]MDW5375304.1 flagellar hook assembly protein FlgD [Halomonas sp. HP20-15]